MTEERNDGGPAFPMLVRDFDNDCGENGEYFYRMEGGASLRDYFAAKAMQAMLAPVAASKTGGPFDEFEHASRCISEMSYFVADAMLKAREQ
jgi:hypothetical protein